MAERCVAGDGEPLALLEAGEESRMPDAAEASATRVGRLALAGGAALLLCAGCAAAAARRHAPEASRPSSLLQIFAKPGRDYCSELGEDCLATGCCGLSGFSCYETAPGVGACMKGCVPGVDGSCTMPQPVTARILVDAMKVRPTMYCFSYAMQDVGSAKAQYDELALLAGQYQRKIGIFACDGWGAWSDQDGELAPGVRVKVVDDPDAEFHFAKRKSTGMWINTGQFQQVWKAVGAEGAYKKFSWVVKLDADAVFLPERLRPILADRAVPPGGIYLENCQYVNYGFFGTLEILSQDAFQMLLDNLDSCKRSLDWRTGIEDGRSGPMSEDLFVQLCLDSVGVLHGEAFEAATDGACEAHRPWDQKRNDKWVPDCRAAKSPQYHPLTTPDVFFACYTDTVDAYGL